jgi:uncharacterized membrane protein YgcG
MIATGTKNRNEVLLTALRKALYEEVDTKTQCRIEALKMTGVDDAPLKEVLGRIWGEEIVSVEGEIEFSYQGGKAPRFWLSKDQSGKVSSGTELLNKIRIALDLPIRLDLSKSLETFVSLKTDAPENFDQKTILFMRRGKNYETYYRDADKSAEVLGFASKPTGGKNGRDIRKLEILVGDEELAIAKLQEAGYSVALADIDEKTRSHVVRFAETISGKGSIPDDGFDGAVVTEELEQTEATNQSTEVADAVPDSTTDSVEEVVMQQPAQEVDTVDATAVDATKSDTTETTSTSSTTEEEVNESSTAVESQDDLPETESETENDIHANEVDIEIVEEQLKIASKPSQSKTKDEDVPSDPEILKQKVSYLYNRNEGFEYLPASAKEVKVDLEGNLINPEKHRIVIVLIQGRPEGTNMDYVGRIQRRMASGFWNWYQHILPIAWYEIQDDGTQVFYLTNGIKRYYALIGLGVPHENYPIQIRKGGYWQALSDAHLANQEHDPDAEDVIEKRSIITIRWAVLNALCDPKNAKMSQNVIAATAGVAPSSVSKYIAGMLKDPYFAAPRPPHPERERYKITEDQRTILLARKNGENIIEVFAKTKYGVQARTMSTAGFNASKKETASNDQSSDASNATEDAPTAITPASSDTSSKTVEAGDPNLFPQGSTVVTVEGAKYNWLSKELPVGISGSIQNVGTNGYFFVPDDGTISTGWVPKEAISLLASNPADDSSNSSNGSSSGSSSGGSRSSSGSSSGGSRSSSGGTSIGNADDVEDTETVDNVEDTEDTEAVDNVEDTEDTETVDTETVDNVDDAATVIESQQDSSVAEEAGKDIETGTPEDAAARALEQQQQLDANSETSATAPTSTVNVDVAQLLKENAELKRQLDTARKQLLNQISEAGKIQAQAYHLEVQSEKQMQVISELVPASEKSNEDYKTIRQALKDLEEDGLLESYYEQKEQVAPLLQFIELVRERLDSDSAIPKQEASA